MVARCVALGGFEPRSTTCGSNVLATWAARSSCQETLRDELKQNLPVFRSPESWPGRGGGPPENRCREGREGRSVPEEAARRLEPVFEHGVVFLLGASPAGAASAAELQAVVLPVVLRFEKK